MTSDCAFLQSHKTPQSTVHMYIHTQNPNYVSLCPYTHIHAFRSRVQKNNLRHNKYATCSFPSQTKECFAFRLMICVLKPLKIEHNDFRSQRAADTPCTKSLICYYKSLNLFTEEYTRCLESSEKVAREERAGLPDGLFSDQKYQFWFIFVGL
jgi:hypothetical protein